jgi:ubiquinone/menaquinone biosynthesis C-methylase UbiE
MTELLTPDFDARAESWDDAGKIERAREVAAVLRRTIPLNRSMRALEYGAGTGLLSFSLRADLGPITLVDSSAGMRAVAERKIATAQAHDMRVIDLDLMRDPVPAERYDLIFGMTVLHHVPDIPRVFAAFRSMLDPGGWLCQVDLDSEDGSFHGPEIDVHHGFDREALRSALAAANFTHISIGDCGSIDHNGRNYPLFIAAAQKP